MLTLTHYPDRNQANEPELCPTLAVIWLKRVRSHFAIFHFVQHGPRTTPDFNDELATTWAAFLLVHTLTLTLTVELLFLGEIYERLVRFKLNSIFCAARADAAPADAATAAAPFPCCMLQRQQLHSNNNKLLNNKVFLLFLFVFVDSCIFMARHISLLRFVLLCLLSFLSTLPLFRLLRFSLKIDFPFTSFCVCVCVCKERG